MRNVSRALALLLCLLLVCRPAGAYSLLTHEQLIDLTWQSSIAPLLRSRYPKITPEELEKARSYAYAGCVIQDIGYYPFGDPFFSDLTHYVRSGDFVVYLFRNAKNANQLCLCHRGAVPLHWRQHGPLPGHQRGRAVEFPKLAAKYGPVVTFGEGQHPHIQTEFAFDIDEIAHRRLAPVHYLRHVGLNVPNKQLATAFYETYGLSENFSKARSRRINAGGFRFAVRSFVPRVAYAVTLSASQPHASEDTARSRAAETCRARSRGWQPRITGTSTGRRPASEPIPSPGFIYVLPKIGPLKLLAIKGPNCRHRRGIRSQRQPSRPTPSAPRMARLRQAASDASQP